MRASPIAAILSVCAAAGVGAWNLKFFMGRTDPAPAVMPVDPPPGDPQLGWVDDPLPAEAEGDTVAVASDDPVATASEAGRTDGPPADGALDFKQLLSQIAARDAAPAKPADETAAVAPPEPRNDSAENAAWERLELRGTLVGADRALALVNGRLLAVGDELPGVRGRIERILADRVIAAPAAGGAPRALTLHKFESPNRKTGNPWNAPGTEAPSSPAEGKRDTGAANQGPPGGSTAAPGGTKGD